MSYNLVIVESPAKAKTINKYLGKGFVVTSSVGHIRDLPQGKAQKVSTTKANKQNSVKLSKWDKLVKRMGIDPYNKWQAHYEIIPGKNKVVKGLLQAAKNADVVYLASDMDREGEAIAWHLEQILSKVNNNFQRVVFNEITKNAIQKAFKQPGKVSLDRVHAQQSRRFLDRIVGFMVSPLLWKKVARGLSAGRVQSVATRVIVERERAINTFIPKEYWLVDADVKTAADDVFVLHLKKYQNKPVVLENKQQTDKVVEHLATQEYSVLSCNKKQTKLSPNPAFITSTLQQAASSKLGFSVKQTMIAAQKLYEAGFITYMRTDSTNLSQDAIENCRSYINQHYGGKYLPDKANYYGKKNAHAQEAHEAIRPSDVNLLAKSIKLGKSEAKLYDLIWRRFVACQMTAAIFDNVVLEVKADDYLLAVSGRSLIFNGFTSLFPVANTVNLLPDNLQVGDKLKLQKLIPSQHFTKPLPRYSEAGLVKELEKMGIGRPSTYAAIISTIQDRGYVEIIHKKFHALKIGELVTDRLIASKFDFMDLNFTATMEDKLDKIAQADENWHTVLDLFFQSFKEQLDRADSSENGMHESHGTMVENTCCPKCSLPMKVRIASSGMFLSCSGYTAGDKNSCRQTLNLTLAQPVEEDKQHHTHNFCPKCKAVTHDYIGGNQYKITLCSNLPDCDYTAVEKGNFTASGATTNTITIQCDKCSADMELKTGRFGDYFGCVACDNTRKVLKNGQVAPPKMTPVDMPDLKCNKVDDHYILRDGAAGLFLAASGFPKKRETRAPLLKELLPYKEQIDAKYHYLFSAPVADDNGNDTITRFDKKLNVVYIGSVKHGKPTKWKIYYEDGKWC